MDERQIGAVQKAVAKHLESIHGRVIPYGPFKGAILHSFVSGSIIFPSRLLGTYEREVTEELVAMSRTLDGPFINIGGGEGYFCTGMVAAGWSKRAYAYEIKPELRRIIAENAAENGCADKVSVDSEASFEKFSRILEEHSQALILSDIEGAEYDLFDERTLELCRNCPMVIELHQQFVPDGVEKTRALLEAASKWFDLRMIQRRVYMPSQFEELHGFDENARLLALSESRFIWQDWVALTPKG